MHDVDCIAPTGCLLGQAPLWSASEGFVWWVDRARAKLHRYNPRTGNTRRYDLPLHASSLTQKQGRLVMIGDLEVGYYDPETEAYDGFITLDQEPATNRTHYGGVAPDGSFWFGTMDRDETRPSGSYYRLGADGELTCLALRPMVVSGMVCFSPDRKTFYTSDPSEQDILAFDHDPETGALSDRRLFATTADVGAYPAGSAMDAEGFLWNAQWAGSRLVRYAPDGRVDRIVQLPVSRPTGLAFGGDALRTLFISSARIGLSDRMMDRQPMAGCLFSLEVETPGLAQQDWGTPR